jgi:hypothetical protein
MPISHYDPDDAALRGSGPYEARPAIDKPSKTKSSRIVHPGVLEWYTVTTQPEDWPFWYVTNDGRTNVLHFPGCGGAVMTSRDCAEEIARRANNKQN